MVREMTARKCSHCGLNGHNSRTCSGGKTGGCLKLFGVKINEQTPIKKSVSLGNLGCLRDDNDHHDDVDDGYVSDGYIGSKKYKAAHERKKGTPWSEEEHRIFLEGLHKLGKGDWRGISKNFVTSRTPTQVASHAQKFFLRHAATDKKKRRTSLFDMNLIESVPASHPKEVPILPANKSALLLKKPAEIPSNATTTPDQVVSRLFPRLCLDNPTPKANHSYTPGVPVPSYAGMPYMVGFSGSKQSYWAAKSIPTASYLHMVNYNYPTVVYPFTSGNFATCAPITAHPSGIPTPKSFLVNYLQGGSSSTSTTRNEDPLELKISLSCQSPRDHPKLQGLIV